MGVLQVDVGQVAVVGQVAQDVQSGLFQGAALGFGPNLLHAQHAKDVV